MKKKISGQRISNAKKVTKTADIITATPAAVERDCQLGVCELAATHDLTYGTLQSILTDLSLVKKLARWIPKFLSLAQKQEQVDCREGFLKLIR
jgi:hypothetical protein